MRIAMIFNMLAIFMFVGNVLDYFQGQEDWSPSLPSIIISGIFIAIFSLYILKTPDRAVVPLHKVKPLVTTEQYKKLKTKGQ